MNLDLTRLRHATLYKPSSPPQIRIRLGIARADHTELCQELVQLSERGVLRQRRVRDGGAEYVAFEWGGA